MAQFRLSAARRLRRPVTLARLTVAVGPEGAWHGGAEALSDPSLRLRPVDRFRFCAGDIVISPPPKCGTTWMQMLCALLVFDTDELDRPLTEISPWLDAVFDDHQAVVAALEGQQHRRFIKTHTPLDGLVFDERVTATLRPTRPVSCDGWRTRCRST